MYFQPMAIGTEPPPHVGVLMIRGIVLDEDGALVAIVLSEQLKESQVGRGVEDAVLSVVESRASQLDSAQNFHRLAFPGDPKLGCTTDAAPRGVQSRVLPETSFVSENQRPVFPVGFFLRLG